MKTLFPLVVGVLIGWACSGLLDHAAVYIRANWN
jgi:hypothetical protein